MLKSIMKFQRRKKNITTISACGYKIIKNSQDRWVILRWRKLKDGRTKYFVNCSSSDTGKYYGYDHSEDTLVNVADSFTNKQDAETVAKKFLYLIF